VSARRWGLVLTGLIVGVGAMGWLATRYRWGPNVPRDPAYRSGRASLCEPPAFEGTPRTVSAGAVRDQRASRGLQRSHVYTVDLGTQASGKIVICSEYGRVRLRGIDGNQARVSVTLLNPFPGGERAVHDTEFTVDVRADQGRLAAGIWQTTQGFTGFRSWLSRGIRATAVNIDVELPRGRVYDLHVVANHDRVDVANLDVQGSIEGYGSPGGDLDVRLGGPLLVHLAGKEYDVVRFPEDEMVIDPRIGVVARVEPLTSTVLEVRCEEAEVRITVVDSAATLQVDAIGINGSALVTRETNKATPGI
jgi:hypothetical protein